jgi:hypothetical protein
MSSNPNDINLSNYEEYFILYMDNELDARGRQMVEAFVLLHPHLAEELDMFMSTKLPVDDVSFYNREDLLSPSMKLNAFEEELLLYVDDEVSSTQRASVEEKISTDKDYASQYSLLMQTKVDAAEIISHPNKKELYRHAERVIYFPVWMRVAVAVIILLFTSFFFFINSNKRPVDNHSVATKPLNPPMKKNSIPEQKTILIPQQKEEPVLVKAPQVQKNEAPILKGSPVKDKMVKDITNNVALQKDNDAAPQKREIYKLDVNRFTETNINDVAVNKTIAHTSVTSPVTTSYIKQNDPLEPAVTDGDFEIEKTTKGKGFFRKVSRFIQRNTGIGTVNADNELLIGAVALKLK